MNTDLVLLRNQMEGIDEEAQEGISSKFIPFLQQVVGWKNRVEGLVVTSSLQRKEIREAKEARIALKRIRIGANKVRELLKRDAIDYGKAVQNVYNVIEEKIKPLEAHLKLQEDFVEIQREKMIVQLGTDRLNKFILENWLEFIPAGLELGKMPVEDYEKMEKYCENQLALKKEEAIKAVQEAADKKKLDDREKERLDELADYNQFFSIEDKAYMIESIRVISRKEFNAFVTTLKGKKKDHEAEQKRIREENERLAKENKYLQEQVVKKDRYEKRQQTLLDVGFHYYPTLPLENDDLYNFSDKEFGLYKEEKCAATPAHDSEITDVEFEPAPVEEAVVVKGRKKPTQENLNKAALDMYEAAKELLRFAKPCERNTGFDNAISGMEAAIKKAEGK